MTQLPGDRPDPDEYAPTASTFAPGDYVVMFEEDDPGTFIKLNYSELPERFQTNQ